MKKMSYLCTAKTSNAKAQSRYAGRTRAPVAELVDASDLGSGVVRRAGSSPVRRTSTTRKTIGSMRNPRKKCPKCTIKAENCDILKKKLKFSCRIGNNCLLLSPIYIN